MKRILLATLTLLTFTFTWGQSGQAPIGEYEVYFEGWLEGANNHHCGKATVELTLYGETSHRTIFVADYWEYSPRVTYNKNNTVKSFSADKRVKKIHFETTRREKSSCNGRRPYNKGQLLDGVSGKYGLDLNTPCFSRYFHFDGSVGFENYDSDKSGLWNSSFTIYIEPNLKIVSPGIRDLLPSDDVITIKSHRGFKKEEYNWQYSLNNAIWISLPQYNEKDEISVSAKDILQQYLIDNPSKTIEDFFNKKIYLRQIACNGRVKSATETYTITPSAPHITSSGSIMPICHNDENGKIEINLDRPIYANESLRVAYTDIESGLPVMKEGDALKIDPTTRDKITLEGLKHGFYDFRFYGNYKYDVSEGDTISLYTDGQRHKGSTTILNRPAIEYTIDSTAVSCFGGKDGRITLDVKGGTGEYITQIIGLDTLSYSRTISFTNVAPSILANLQAGKYQIMIKDLNGCRPQLPYLEEVIVTISQPKEALAITSIDSQEAKGFGRSDGEAWIYMKGGTANYNVVWRDTSGSEVSNTIVTPNREGTGYSKVIGLKAGLYHVEVKDNKYANVNPSTEENTKGCFVSDTIRVHQPPKIEVDIKETRYITCFGDSDGELTAHARGGRENTALGSLPYTYTWTKTGDPSFAGLNDSIISGLSFGEYTVEITDINGIKETQTYKLEQPPVLRASIVILKHNDCADDAAGSMEVIATGGVAPYTYEWSNGETTQEINGLTKGEYSVIVRDSRFTGVTSIHHCSAIASDTITDPAYITTVVSQTRVSCNGGKDGKIHVTPQGGRTGIYTAYLFQNGIELQSLNVTLGNTATFMELSKGDYEVFVKDSNDCELTVGGVSSNMEISVTEPDAVDIVSHEITEPLGFGLSNGWAQITFNGGTSPYVVEWFDEDGNPVTALSITTSGTNYVSKAENLKKGIYSIVIKDTNYLTAFPQSELNTHGCIDTISISMPEPPLLEVEVSEKRYVTCLGDSDGELLATAKGGRPHLSGTLSYDYQWYRVEGSTSTSLGVNNDILDGLTKGYYKVVVTDRNGIQAESSVFFLDEPPVLAATTNVLLNNDCAGDSAGSMEVIPTGGVAPYTYEWSTGDTTRVISGLPKGRYYVTVRDSRYNGVEADHHCAVILSDTITAPEYIEVTKLEETPVSCFGGKDGKIHILARGGDIGTYTVYLSQLGVTLDSLTFNEGDVATFTDLAQGKYDFYVTDANDCQLTTGGLPYLASIIVTEPTPVVIHYYNSTEPLGYGLSNGTAEVVFKGGTAPYNVIWTDEDGNNIPTLPLETRGDSIVSRVINIRSTTYYITVQDKNFSTATPQNELNTCGCTDTVSFFVPQPPPLEVNVEELRYVTCFGDKDGAIVAHSKGGRPFLTGKPYVYKWVKEEDGVQTPIWGADSTNHELYSGYYRVEITDRNGITKLSDRFHLVQPEPLVVTTKVLQNTICSGDSIGAIEAFATGGTPPYSYIWSNNDTTKVVTGLTQGYYVVGVRDARYKENMLGHYCITQAYDSIISPNSIRIIGNITHPTCAEDSDGELKVTIRGGVAPYTYTWDDVNIQNLERKSLRGGKYKITVHDSGGCFWSETFELIQPEPIIVDLGSDFTLCKDQTVTINGLHSRTDLSYVWTDENGAQLSTNAYYEISKAGKYKLVATSPEGCRGEDQIIVSQVSAELTMDFVLATKAANNSSVYAINITRSQIDSLVWIIPDNVEILHQSGDKIELLFDKNGEYIIGMIGYKDGCEDILYKPILIVDEWEIEDEEKEIDKEAFIKSFYVTPNPNNGNFEAIIELRESTDFSLTLVNFEGMKIDEKRVMNEKSSRVHFDGHYPSFGLHFLLFKSKEATEVFKVIIR